MLQILFYWQETRERDLHRAFFFSSSSSSSLAIYAFCNGKRWPTLGQFTLHYNIQVQSACTCLVQVVEGKVRRRKKAYVRFHFGQGINGVMPKYGYGHSLNIFSLLLAALKMPLLSSSLPPLFFHCEEQEKKTIS